MIITIDGPVATGKTTIAKRLAERLGYIFFDTGAMYRAFTYKLIHDGIDYEDPAALTEALKNFDYDVRMVFGEKKYYVDHRDVTEQIRSPGVTALVSKISAIKAVREKLVQIQREVAQGVYAVFEGRDMGSVVFPDADLKIFLTGREDVRAKRRYDEMLKQYPEMKNTLKIEDVTKELHKRDLFDSTREISPLKKADDAYEIDTSDFSVEQIVNQILELKDMKQSKGKK